MMQYSISIKDTRKRGLTKVKLGHFQLRDASQKQEASQSITCFFSKKQTNESMSKIDIEILVYTPTAV